MRTGLARGLAWLVREQGEDGSWARGTIDSLLEEGYALESFHAWRFASHALACRALAEAPETPERRAALERAVGWLCATRLPKRGSDWDVDMAWSALYGFDACVALALDPRFAAEPWKSRLATRGMELHADLRRLQSVDGGWGYYDFPPYPSRNMWSTSFSTACVIPALVDAKERLGWEVDEGLLARAVRYVEACRLPNGAYSYDLTPIPRITGGEHINEVKGSLGRIQVCNLALARAGVERVDADELRRGLELLFANHAFLDAARMKPIPHESYYANAGYFYFFAHYHAARVIELLPPGERERWRGPLARHLLKVQEQNGSFVDFQAGSYLRVADTAFACMALCSALGPGGR
jgi:hypothetical protein